MQIRSDLATGAVKGDLSSEMYVAKRMEGGAVLGAAPRRAVITGRRLILAISSILLGATVQSGRDGCGGCVRMLPRGTLKESPTLRLAARKYRRRRPA
ncbi:MAG: hypothetical protein ACLTLQ_08900 [[Clostridium] scindens]